MGMNDGLKSLQIISDTLSGNTLDIGTTITSAELGSGTILGANISGAQLTKLHIISGNVLSQHISGAQLLAQHQKIIGTGSPTVFGNSVIYGEFVTGGGSTANHVFGTAFAAAPIVIAGGLNTAGWVQVTTVSAGSVQFSSQVASTSGTFIALGSGNI